MSMQFRLVFLVALAASIHGVWSQIYLSPDGADTWTRWCPYAGCPASQPCGIPSGTVPNSADCDIVFVPGQYGGQQIMFVGSGAVTLSQVSESQDHGFIDSLNVTSHGPVVTINDTNWKDSYLVFYNLPSLNVRDSSFLDTPISFLENVPEIHFMNCTLQSQDIPLLTSPIGATGVLFSLIIFEQSSLSCEHCMTLLEFKSKKIVELRFDNSIVTAQNSLLAANHIQNLDMKPVNVTNFNGALLEVTYRLESFLLTTGSQISATNGSSTLFTLYPLQIIFQNSILKNLVVGDLRSQLNLVWQYIYATDISVRFPSQSPSFFGSTFIRTLEYHPSGNPFFWIQDFRVAFDDITFEDQFLHPVPLQLAGTPVFLMDNGTFLSPSLMSATSLTIRGNVTTVGALYINRALYGDWSGSTPPTLQAASSGVSNWVFRSIFVSAVVNFKSVGFTYLVTGPGGISTPCAYRGSLIAFPPTTTVIWKPIMISNPPIIGSPSNLYPIGFFTPMDGFNSTEVRDDASDAYITGAFVIEKIPGSSQGDRLSFWLSEATDSVTYINGNPLAPIITQPCGCILPGPGDEFECVSGNWQFTGSLEVPTISLPSGALIVVLGNLSVSTINFNGLGTTVNVSGCANITDGITITVNPDEIIPGTKQQLIQQNGLNCSLSLQNIALSLISLDPSDCKQVTVTTSSDSTPSSLTVLFGLDESSCSPKKKDNNTRWIILGSVLGGVLLITTVLLLVFTLNPAAKNLVRPFHARKMATRNVMDD